MLACDAQDLWKYSTLVTGAEWPLAYQPKSPCPTLKVVGAVTKVMNAKEEAKRMKPGPGVVGGAAGHVADAVLGHTIGFAAKKAQDLLLGELPEEAVEGSFQTTKSKKAKGGRKGFRRLLFWRRGKEAEAAVEEVEVEVEEVAAAAPRILSVDEQAALEARLDEVLDGGFAVPSAKAALEACLLDEEECEVEEALEKAEQLGQIVRK